MPHDEIFESIAKLRAHAERVNRQDLLISAEDIENIAMEEVFGLTFEQRGGRGNSNQSLR